MSRKLIGLVVGLALFGLSGPANAVPMNYSYQGTFAADDSVQLLTFESNGVDTVRLLSLGYGGGTQADGTVVSAGGFDPIFAIFDSSGAVVVQNDDSAFGPPGACGGSVVNADPNNFESYDSCLQLVLAAGIYTVSITLADNFAVGPNLAAGFMETGNPNYTAIFYDCTNGQFCDASGSAPFDNRTNAWALDINGVEYAGIVVASEPRTLGLFAFALAGLGFMARRRKL